MPKYLKLVFSFLVAILVFFLSGHFAVAAADDLVIMDDGSVVLVITNPVLAASTDNIEEAKQILGKILVAPAHAQNTVEVDPKPTKDQKINVTIKTESKEKNKPPKEEKKKVDQIVAQGADKKPVFTIKSNKASEVTIKQGNVEASTPLPLTINTKSKAVSTKVGNEQVNIQVLPQDVAKVAEQKGVNKEEKITLTQEGGQAIYKETGNKKERILNLFDLSSPVEVAVSAQTGKTLRISQPLYFSVLDLFKR